MTLNRVTNRQYFTVRIFTRGRVRASVWGSILCYFSHVPKTTWTIGHGNGQFKCPNDLIIYVKINDPCGPCHGQVRGWWIVMSERHGTILLTKFLQWDFVVRWKEPRSMPSRKKMLKFWRLGVHYPRIGLWQGNPLPVLRTSTIQGKEYWKHLVELHPYVSTLAADTVS